MIQQSTENGNTQVELNTGFIAAIREMQISKLLHDANIRKDIISYLSQTKHTLLDVPQYIEELIP